MSSTVSGQFKPKITGLLNNCAINCALPILLDRIRYWASLEAQNALSGIEENETYQQYVLFKHVFAGHYGIADPHALTWRQFDYFLNAHSFFAKELIFAPVFRDFIAKHALDSGEYRLHDLGNLRDIQDVEKDWFDVYFASAEQLKKDGATECYAWHNHQLAYIDSTGHIHACLNNGELGALLDASLSPDQRVFRFQKQQIERLKQLNSAHQPEHVQYEGLISAGRYNHLDYTEVVRLFYQPLSIVVDVFDYDDNSKTYIEQPHAPSLREATGLPYIESTQIYLKNHHYELQPHDVANGAGTHDSFEGDACSPLQEMMNEMEQLPELLYDVYLHLNDSESSAETNQALGLLQLYVQQAFVENLNQISETKTTQQHYFVSVEVYAQSGQEYHNKTSLGYQTFAMILLILLKDNHALSDEQSKLVQELKELLDESSSQPQAGCLAEIIVHAIASEGQTPLPSYWQAKNILTATTPVTSMATTGVADSAVISPDESAKDHDTHSNKQHKTPVIEASSGESLTTDESVIEQSFSSTSTDVLLPVSKMMQPDASFLLSCMHGLCVLGGVCLIVGFLTYAPVATAIGMTAVMGSTSILSQVATGLGVSSLLLSAGIFAYRCFQVDEEAKPNHDVGLSP